MEIYLGTIASSDISEMRRMSVGTYVECGSIDGDRRRAAGIDQATSVMTFDYADRNSRVV